jgi:hypothetical protein
MLEMQRIANLLNRHCVETGVGGTETETPMFRTALNAATFAVIAAAMVHGEAMAQQPSRDYDQRYERDYDRDQDRYRDFDRDGDR